MVRKNLTTKGKIKRTSIQNSKKRLNVKRRTKQTGSGIKKYTRSRRVIRRKKCVLKKY